jgi:formylglycine-generating enzyme required for sulfatase activity
MQKKLFSAMIFFIVLCAIMAQTVFCDVVKIEDMDHKSGKMGSFQALLIGIDSYKDGKIADVKTATKGAMDLGAVLKRNYGYSTQFLLNGKATKDAIIGAVKSIGARAGKSGSVLIYFAGQSTSAGKGAWFPVDAKAGDESSYLAHEDFQGMIAAMKAKSVLVISDAAYPDTYFGSVHKLPAETDDRYYLDLYRKQGRWGLSSGNDFPRNRFTPLLATALAENENPHMSLLELYEKVKGGISAGTKYPPRCRSLRNAGDQGGEPVFVMTPAILEKIEEKKLLEAKKEGFLNAPIEDGSVIALVVSVPDALIVLDNTAMGKGGVVKLSVNPGNHVIEVKKDGYEPFKKTLFVKKEAQLPVTVDLKKIVIKPTKGNLTITAQPSNAEIRLVNVNTPYVPGMSLEGGTYQVEVTAPLHEKVTHDVAVKVSENNTYSFNLTPIRVIRHKNLGNFILVNHGSFTMGSPDNETKMRGANEKQHKVTLSKPMYVQEHEMTVGQWKWFVKAASYKTEAETGGGANALVEYNWEKDSDYNWQKPGFAQNDKHPVTCVSWNDTQAFIKWINKAESGIHKFRLPTEAEWEYVCRAGTTDRFYFGTCLTKNQANYDGSSKWEDCPMGEAGKGTYETGKYPANAWGFYDMHGNVMEWCQDFLANYPEGEVTDPPGPQTGTEGKVVRGGGWASFPYNLRSAKRFSRNTSDSYSDTGFRLVIEP